MTTTTARELQERRSLVEPGLFNRLGHRFKFCTGHRRPGIPPIPGLSLSVTRCRPSRNPALSTTMVTASAAHSIPEGTRALETPCSGHNDHYRQARPSRGR